MAYCSHLSRDLVSGKAHVYRNHARNDLSSCKNFHKTDYRCIQYCILTNSIFEAIYGLDSVCKDLKQHILYYFLLSKEASKS